MRREEEWTESRVGLEGGGVINDMRYHITVSSYLFHHVFTISKGAYPS